MNWGPEFVATAILRWLQTAQIETAFIDPDKPWAERRGRILQRKVARSALIADDVRIYNRALSAAEVQKLYQAGK